MLFEILRFLKDFAACRARKDIVSERKELMVGGDIGLRASRSRDFALRIRHNHHFRQYNGDHGVQGRSGGRHRRRRRLRVHTRRTWLGSEDLFQIKPRRRESISRSTARIHGRKVVGRHRRHLPFSRRAAVAILHGKHKTTQMKQKYKKRDESATERRCYAGHH